MELLPVLIVAKLFTSILTYHITVPDIFGDSLQKCYWQDFKLVVLSIVWKETHAYSLNGIATFNLAIIIRDSMIHQTAKFKMTACQMFQLYCMHLGTYGYR